MSSVYLRLEKLEARFFMLREQNPQAVDRMICVLRDMDELARTGGDVDDIHGAIDEIEELCEKAEAGQLNMQNTDVFIQHNDPDMLAGYDMAAELADRESEAVEALLILSKSDPATPMQMSHEQQQFLKNAMTDDPTPWAYILNSMKDSKH